MKKFYYLAVIMLTAGLVIQACGHSEDSAEEDRKLMQGAWAGTVAGMDIEFTMAVSDNNFDLKAADSITWYKGTFVLNDKVTPKQADFKISECGLEEYVGTTANGLYKIENDTLTIAACEPGSEIRPADFGANEMTQVFTFKRK